MLRKVIHRVTEMGRQQGMSATLTFADRHGHELEDRLGEVPDDNTSHEEYDPYYDDDSTSTGDGDLSYDTNDDGDDDDDDAGHAPTPATSDHHDVIAAVPVPPVLDDDPVLFGPGNPPVGGNNEQHSLMNPDQEPQNAPDDLMSTGVVENDVDDSTGKRDDMHVDDDDETTGVEDDLDSEDDSDTGVGEKVTPMTETIMDDELLEDDDTHPTTESHKFQQAVADGVSRAHKGTIQQPTRRHAKKVKDPAFEDINLIFKEMEPQTVFTMLMEQDSTEMMSFITEQMSAKRGLKQFGTAGADTIMKELRQLVYRKVMEGHKSGDLTTAQKKAALKYLMFLKQKRCGKIKGRGCADGRKQRLYKNKEDTTSPTITAEALFLTCLTDAIENRHVVTCDVPGAFMHSDIDELVHLKLEGKIAELLVKVDPTYAEFVSKE